MLSKDLFLAQAWRCERGCTGGGDRILGGETENLTGGPTTLISPHVVWRIVFIVSRAWIWECLRVAWMSLLLVSLTQVDSKSTNSWVRRKRSDPRGEGRSRDEGDCDEGINT